VEWRCPQRREAAKRAIRWCLAATLRAVLFGGLVLGAPLASRAGESPKVDLNLRLQWLFEQPATVRGSVAISDGRLHLQRNLSLDSASTGGLRLSDDLRRLSIDGPATSERGGCEFQVQGPGSAVVTLELRSAGAEPPVVIERTLTELASETIHQEFGAAGRLYLSRVPADALRLDLGGDSLIFNTSQMVQPRLEVRHSGAPAGAAMALRVQLQAARGGKAIESRRFDVVIDAAGSAPLVDTGLWQLPAEEGAYEFQISLHMPSTLPWRWNSPLVQRRVQCVVVNSSSPSEVQDPAALLPETWKERVRMQAGDWQRGGWGGAIPDGATRWLRGQRPIEGLLIANGSDAERENAAGVTYRPLGERTIASLAPEAWQAIPLKGLEPGRRHRMRIVYPAGGPHARLGVSLVEPDAAGRVGPPGIDSGIVGPSLAAPTAGDWLEQQIEFWPRTAEPWVLFFNRDSSHAASYAELIVESTADRPLRGPAVLGSTNPRLATVYLDKPLLAQCLGATKFVEDDATTAIEDWVTFLEAGQRLVTYVQSRGCNSAVITVASEGGAIYPSARLLPIPRFEMGAFQLRGQDPQPKDVLELLMRLFDRAGLRLIPALELATPLVELESLRDRDPKALTGADLVDAQGRTIAAQPGNSGPRPLYNPLHPQVQGAVERVVGELVQRYRKHASFAGIALRLEPASYLQLPGDRWARDAQTIARFRSTLPGSVPRDIDFQQWIDGPGTDLWRRWRCLELANWYGRMARQLGAEQRLWLLATDCSAGDAERTDDNDARPTAMAQGIDWAAIAALPKVVAVRTVRQRTLAPLQRQLEDEAQNALALVERRPAGSSASLLYYPPVQTRLPSFEGLSPWGPAQTRAWFYSIAAPSLDAPDSGRLLIETLAAGDQIGLWFGSWLPPAVAASSPSWLEQWAQLPASEFQDVPSDDVSEGSIETLPVQPAMIVRQAVEQDVTWLYVANPAAAPQRFEARWQLPEGTAIRTLGGPSPEQLDAQGWRATIPAGGFQAIRIEDRSVVVRQWQSRFELADVEIERLRRELESLRDRLPRETPIEIAQQPRNHDFAQDPVSKQVVGWLHSQHTAAQVTATIDPADSTRDCLLLRSTQENKATTWLISDPLPAPTTGRLQVCLFARTDDSSHAARLRLAVEARYQGQPLRRSLSIDAGDAGRLPRGWGAAPIRLQAIDLPTEGLEDVRLAIDWIGEGKVWIDRVELSTSFLTERERGELQRRTFVALEDLRGGDPRTAADLLDRPLVRVVLPTDFVERDHGVPASGTTAPETAETPLPETETDSASPRAASRFREWITPRWR
jgi:hypothetical protein